MYDSTTMFINNYLLNIYCRRLYVYQWDSVLHTYTYVNHFDRNIACDAEFSVFHNYNLLVIQMKNKLKTVIASNYYVRNWAEVGGSTMPKST